MLKLTQELDVQESIMQNWGHNFKKAKLSALGSLVTMFWQEGRRLVMILCNSPEVSVMRPHL